MCSLYYSFQSPYEITEQETEFQGHKQYYKVQRMKMVGLGQFLWMADNMRWFQRTGKILIGKKVTQMHAGEDAVTKYNEIK